MTSKMVMLGIASIVLVIGVAIATFLPSDQGAGNMQVRLDFPS